MSEPASAPLQPPSSTVTAGGWVRRVLLLALAVAVAVAVLRILGAIAWEQVWAALGQLSWWHPLVLVVLLLLRQVLNASPLAFYISGISLYRATLNDLGASTMAAVAPPPGDIALRVAMFTSWGVHPSRAMAGAVMNSLTFFIVRFGAPLPGFVLLVIAGQQPGLRLLDVLSLLISAAILGGILLTVRTSTWASVLGHGAARVVRRVRPSVQPAAWARTCEAFRDDIAATFDTGFPRAVLATCAMVTTDLLVLTLCLRFVGVSAQEVTVLQVAVAFLFAYPLTLFPMQGAGVVDAVVLASLVEAAGSGVVEPAVAAMVIWRVFTIAGPFLLGLGAVYTWRRTTSSAGR